MTASNEFIGKVALITGGARGIGRGIALKLAQSGCDLVINYLEREDAAYEVAEWVRGLGRKVHLVKADMCNEDQVVELFRQAQSEFGKLDILVNNAGPFKIRKVLEMPSDEWHLMLDGNLNSAFYVAKHGAALMKRNENGGNLIFIGAPNAERIGSQSESCAYSIAKTGVVILALTLARDLGPDNIRVNVVNPGFIENDSMTPRMREWMPHEVPLGRIGTPANIADAVEFLCSDRASYINGEILNVHGGIWV